MVKCMQRSSDMAATSFTARGWDAGVQTRALGRRRTRSLKYATPYPTSGDHDDALHGATLDS